MSLESKLLRPDRLSVITKMFSWPVGSKDEGAAPEIDSQIDPDITLDITLEYQPRDRPMIPESARAEFWPTTSPRRVGLASCARRGAQSSSFLCSPSSRFSGRGGGVGSLSRVWRASWGA